MAQAGQAGEGDREKDGGEVRMKCHFCITEYNMDSNEAVEYRKSPTEAYGFCSHECFDRWMTREIRRSGLNTNEHKPDNINSPPHYTSGGIECIDAIRAALTDDEFRGYCKGSMIKYIWRERLKGGVESLAKAEWYNKRLIKELGE